MEEVFNESLDNQAKSETEVFNIKDFLSMCLGKWYWFAISLILCLGLGVLFILRSEPVFVSSADVMIKDDSQAGSAQAGLQSFMDMGLLTTNTTVYDEMQSFASPDLMREVVTRLNLNMQYRTPKTFYAKTLYGTTLPVNAIISGLKDDQSASFRIDMKKDGAYTMYDFRLDGEKVESDEIKGRLDAPVKTPIGQIIIRPTAYWGKLKADEPTIIVSRIPVTTAVEGLCASLKVDLADDKANVIALSLPDVSKERGVDILKKLIDIYNENWMKDKNQVAVNTSLFINERLGVIEDELGNVDNTISSFKSTHLLPDVESVAKMYMEQAATSSEAVNTLQSQAQVARYIRNLLTSDRERFTPLPVNTGFKNTAVEAQITEYNKMVFDRNELEARSTARNPLVIEMDNQLSAARSALLTAVDNQLMAINTELASQQSYGNQARAQIQSNPKQAKELLSVERQQKVKEELYLYLLQKREENELSQAYNAYNTRIIKLPKADTLPKSPKKASILIIAFVCGLMFPALIIYMRENLNTRVRGRKDIERVTTPFVGEIPQKPERRHLLVKKKVNRVDLAVEEGNRDIINEAFRVLRTNLEFMTPPSDRAEVIVVTSFNPGSGKSFITINLGMSLAIKGKKVLVIDGDLRRGSTSAYIDSPQKGLSGFLTGRIDDVHSIIVHHPSNPNLSVLPIGVMPPNPTELLFSDRLASMMAELGKEYDYILIDCPPIEVVADTMILEKFADRTLFVIRAGLFERSMIPEIDRLYGENKYKNMSIILNGTQNGGSNYGNRYRYGYGYGYGNGYHYGKKS